MRVHHVRPAAHDAVRVADVEHASRAARRHDGGGTRWWIAGGFALGPAVFVHPTAPLYALTAFGCAVALRARAAGARSCAKRGPARSRCWSPSCPYYAKTLHVLSDRYGVGQGSKHGGAARSAAAPSGKTRSTSSRRGRTTSTTSRFSRLLGLVVLAVGASRARARILRAHRARARRLLQRRPGDAALGALLRPLHDPGDPGLPVRRLQRLARARRPGGASSGLLGPRPASSPGSSRSSSVSTSITATRCTAHPRRPGRPGRRRRRLRGTVLFGSTGHERAALLRPSATATRRTSSTTSSRCGFASLLYVDDDSCEPALAFVQRRRPGRGIWLFYAAGGSEVAARRGRLRRCVAGDRAAGEAALLRRPLEGRPAAALADRAGAFAASALAACGAREPASRRSSDRRPAALGKPPHCVP